MAKGGAQEYFNVMPDITTLGKIIGGGLPVGAYGGKKEIMDQLAPNGPIYQAGTLSGNPLAMAAGSTMLKLILNTADFYPELERKAKKLEEGIRNNLKETGIKAVLNRVGSMMTLFFTNEEKVSSYDEAMSADTNVMQNISNYHWRAACTSHHRSLSVCLFRMHTPTKTSTTSSTPI